MKGFLSYAHDDVRMVDRFRRHLAAVEQAFDIAFWFDERIEAGHHWNDFIHLSINEAHIFILLMSPSYIASRYIRDHEIPAIAKRTRTANGLVCPVILTRCAWEPVVGQLQVVPSRGRKLVPISEWQPQDRGHDEARARIEAAIRSHFNLIPKTQNWFEPLIGLREEQPGPVWVERGNQFDLDPSGSDSDTTAAADHVTTQLHTLNRKKAVAFATRIARLGNSLGPEWNGLIAAASDLADILKLPTEEIPDQVATLWEASVRLASFLELDKRLLAERRAGEDPLPRDVHRAFDDLVGSVAPWVRRFPTAREMDDARGAYLASPSLFAPSARLIQIASETSLITLTAADSMRASIETVPRSEVQGQKAGSHAIKGARGLITRSGSYVAGFLAGAMASGYAAHSPLIDRIGRFLAQAESSITGLVADFPADFRHALDRLVSNAGRPNFPAGDAAGVLAAAIAIVPPADQAQRPEGFDLNHAKDMILRGEMPPPAWHPFIDRLDFTKTSLNDLRLLAELTALQSLDLMDTPVNNLAPLASLTALQSLNIAGTKVTDVTPLANLTALQALNLMRAQVTSLMPLADLTNLQGLFLMDAPARDLAPLAGLTALQSLLLIRSHATHLAPLAKLTALLSLDLQGMRVSDVTPLAGLTALLSLNLRGTHVSHVTPLAGLAALESLDLQGTQVTDVTPLAGLTALQRLDLQGTQVTDLTPLAGLTALQSLDLVGTQVTDVTPLAGLTALQRLDLQGTQVTDVTRLAGLTALELLSLSATQVTDVTPLAGLTALRSLDLGDTQVSDVTPLAGLTALESLDLQGTQVTDVTPLAGLTALELLSLSATQVTDVTPLAGLTALEVLSLSATQVTDVTPLAGLTALQYLDLVGTQVTDVTPLAGLTALQRLDLQGTQVTDLTPLAGLTALQSLDLVGTQVTDLTPLAGLTALRSLYLQDTQVTDVTPLAGLTALRSLDLQGTLVRDVRPLRHIQSLEILTAPIPRRRKKATP